MEYDIFKDIFVIGYRSVLQVVLIFLAALFINKGYIVIDTLNSNEYLYYQIVKQTERIKFFTFIYYDTHTIHLYKKKPI